MSSNLDEKLSGSVTKQGVLYDKRCADKLKTTLAFMGELLHYFAKLLFFKDWFLLEL